ncbi:MAG TPA: dethiobiotin synthase [Candidatus Binataceae bacterium]|nr:dethiobiotin synthase [Candidatus Binataceae bacterium]
MAHGVLITATEPGAGKTLIGCALAFAAHSRGMRVGVMKPIATGCGDVNGILESTDARGLAYAAACDAAMELMCPYRYANPILAPDNSMAPDLLQIAEAYRKIVSHSDFIIVEGFDAIATPIALPTTLSRPKDSLDLARTLNLDVLIVARNGPGCLNASRLAIAHAQNRGVGIVGVILNDVDANASSIVESNLESLHRLTQVPILGRVRFKQPVTREIIDPILNRIA